MELDGDAGVRGTFDKFSFDLGGIVYGYPDTPTGVHVWNQPTFGTPFGTIQTIGLTPRNDTWGEVYFKPTYTINDWITVGANFFYTPTTSPRARPPNICRARSRRPCPSTYVLG